MSPKLAVDMNPSRHRTYFESQCNNTHRDYCSLAVKNINSVNQSSMVRYGIMSEEEDSLRCCQKMVKATDKAPERDAAIAADILKSIKTELTRERMKGRSPFMTKTKKKCTCFHI